MPISKNVKQLLPDNKKHETDKLQRNLQCMSDTLHDPLQCNLQDDRIKLSVQQSKIYEFLAEQGQGFTNSKRIKRATGVPLRTIFYCLKSLRKQGIISYKKYRKGSRQGIVFSVNLETHVELTIKHDAYSGDGEQ